MFTLHKGSCEHCSQVYHYTLLHAGFGDFSYAYCNACGMLATFTYSNGFLLNMPPISAPHQVIDIAWEPFIRLCECGGNFQRSASPRCLSCNEPLSAEHAAAHIERNNPGGGRNWRWQRNWTDLYCLAIEDPMKPGTLRQVNDPFLSRSTREEKPVKSGWLQVFSFSR